MKNNRLIEILETNIQSYLNNISHELERSHYELLDDFGFPIFGEITKESREQIYFQSYLESYTRKLINNIIKDICDEELGDYIFWPEFECPELYEGWNNTESEKKFGYEFINIDKRIGYRYTNIRDINIESLPNHEKVDDIVIVSWENYDSTSFYDDEHIKEVSISKFFKLFFMRQMKLKSN